MSRPQSYRQTIEQLRAQQAWEAIEQVEREDSYKHKYGTVARELPARIQVNGLAATMAFLQAKAHSGGDVKLEFLRMYEHISARLDAHLQIGKPDVLDLIRSEPTEIYRHAAAEAIAYSNWLKRYVEAKGWKSSENDS